MLVVVELVVVVVQIIYINKLIKFANKNNQQIVIEII